MSLTLSQLSYLGRRNNAKLSLAWVYGMFKPYSKNTSI